MSDDELRRDIAEEDEVRALLRLGRRADVPPFAAVAERARRTPDRTAPLIALGAIVLLVAGAVLYPRAGAPAAVSASPVASLPPPSSTPVATTMCATPSSRELARRQTGPTLTTILTSVDLGDRRTNQMRWTLRFLAARDAPGPATIGVQAEIRGGGEMLHVLSYELVEPERRALKESENPALAPCGAMTIVIRTAGPLLEGTWPYVVTVWKIGLPEGRTLSETVEVTLTCSNSEWSCVQAPAGATQPPGPTPNVALLNPSFGVVYWGAGGGSPKGSVPLIRREGETATAVGELVPSYFNRPQVAVAADGYRAVYTGQRQNEPWGVYLVDGRRPNEQRRLVSLPDEIPGRPIWAPDMSAVAFTVQDAGATQGVAPKYDSIRTLDLASGKIVERARTTDGSYYHLVGWDKASDTIAALIIPHASAPSTYLVISPSGTKATPLETRGGDGYSMSVSADARTVAGVRCDGPPGCALWTWPLADYAAHTDQALGAGLSLAILGWRPGSNELALAVSTMDPAATDRRIELWSLAGGRREIYRFPPDTGSGGLPAFFRPDGSALLLALDYRHAEVVDLATGATSALPLPAPTQPWDRAVPAASIRLGAP